MPLSVEVIGSPLTGLRQRTSNPALRTRMLREGLAAWRSVIREEFAREAWNSPSGGYRAWAPTKQPFGDFPRSSKKLSRTGRLLNAYMGGSGGFERVTANGIEFGVLGSVIPYAAVHRGGGTKILLADASRPQLIPVTPKSRAFLHFHNVHLKAGTKFIVIPRRPHATANPEVRTRIAAIFAARLAGKEPLARLTQ